ncbi:diguanylate cyclase [Lysobacter sp. Root690]|uniref:diguanylate cyclase n=1 Tax=Lysobacter sp. Root690 TaxID=1736588 RepID=UPI0009EB31AC|nr:diguanylate cyclase [Lysobacter sp. Root690]
MEANSSREINELDTLISEASTLILSPKEVTLRLNSLAENLFAKRLLVEVEHHGQRYQWGCLDEQGPQTVLRKGALSTAVGFEVRGDRYPVTEHEQSFLTKFADLARALWGNDVRSMGGPNWKPESVQAKLARSVERVRAGDTTVAILYGDLDYFKELNDQAGHERGNDAIRLVNRELHDLCLQHGGLPFHPSGDEYYLILPDKGLLPMMEALFELRRRIKDHQFIDQSGRGHNVDLTLGLNFFHGLISVESLEGALVNAEEATKAPAENLTGEVGAEFHEGKSDDQAQIKPKKNKRRGKLSIFGISDVETTQIAPDDFAQLAAVMVRRNTLTSPAVFRDPRLGMVQSAVCKYYLGDKKQSLDEHLRDVQAWLDLALSEKFTVESLLKETAPKAIPRIGLAAAVAGGILKAQHNINHEAAIDIRIRFVADGRQVSVVDNTRTVWGDDLADDAPGVYEVEIEVPGSERPACVLVGIQVGFQESLFLAGLNKLPNELFSQVVIVDDRPSSGGGLPDFWQAALAQVCEVATTGPDLIYVFAWGAARNSETVSRLQGMKPWSEDEIARLANVPSSKVRGLQPQLKTNTILFDDAKSVVNELYKIAPVVSAPPKPKSPEKQLENEPLAREMLKLGPLQATDGLRCRSASQAYPIIIDTLRKAVTRDSTDDARQPLRELVAFKLTLETPNAPAVPGYLREQEDDMNRYAQDVLLSEGGLINRGLASNNQLIAFKKELLACFSGEGPRSTRRACLVVPHFPAADGNPSPAGLVSVWASPRINSSSVEKTVDWVFVWRTVEAFIGLPYSLYGSTALAKSLLEQINHEQPGTEATPFRLGELTYIALSLHMRSDGVHHRIAKRIVDESSE